jgi:hypothetical protein
MRKLEGLVTSGVLLHAPCDSTPAAGQQKRFLNITGVSCGDAWRLPRLETEASVKRGGDIDHVYALQEVVPGRGSAESHPA